VRIDNLPPPDLHNVGVLNWCGWWAFASTVHFQGYVDLFSAAATAEPKFNDKTGVTEWRFPSAAWSYTEMVVQAKRRDGEIVLTRIEQHNYLGQEALDRHDQTKIFCSKILDFGGSPLPSLPIGRDLTVISSNWPTNAEPFWGVCRVRLLDARAIDPAQFAPGTFLEPIAANAMVGDGRLNVAYQVGDTFFNYDGQLYEADRPLTADVVPNFEFWLSHAHVVADRESAATQPNTDD
jgi:hypothetical protein